MGENEFLLDIISVLNETVSKRRIKEGLKGMDDSMFVKVIAKLSIALSQRQLKKDLKQLDDLYLQIGADLKIDSALKKKLQGRIKTLQDSISDLQIGVSTKKSSDIAKAVTEVRNKGQRAADKTAISFNIEVKREKAIADLEYIAKKYSKLFSNASASQKYNNILDAAYGITDAKQLSNVRAQIAAFTSELKANDLASQSLGDKWKRLIDRSKDLFSAASAVTLIFSQVRQAVSSFLQLDTAMTNLYKVQDQITSRDQFSGLLTKWNKLAQDLAVTTESLISSMEAWSKIGFNLDMSEQLAEITSIFEKTAEITNEKATSTLISAAQAFTEIDDLGVDDYVKRVEAVGDKINAIGQKYAIDSEGIADGLQNASAALKVAGNDLNETIALITATNKIFQNPEEGSNMLKVASMRLRGQVDALKEMGEDAEGVSTDLTKIQQQVYELTGNKVNIFEDDENLKSTYQMVLEIGEVFDSLSDRSQADLLEVMFGKQRASAGAALLLNYEELEKIKNDSINAANSMAEEYSKYMESASAHITIFKEKLVETYSTFMSGDLIKYTSDLGSGILDLVNSTDLLRHGILAVLSLNIGKGITSLGASIASTVKQMNTLGNALQQVKNLPVDEGLRKKALQEIGKETKNLSESNLKLLLSQKQLEDNDKITILTKHKLTNEEAKLKLEKLGLLSVTKTQTTANVAEAATTGTLRNAMLSLKMAAKEVGATIKGMFANNPIGMGFMLATTAISVFSTAISKVNEKLEETRRANIESATTASENADKLKDLYNEYTRLASIQDRTTSEEEAFKTAVENITVALGDKAEILKDLTAGTDEYADALARVTKEELQSQAVAATIGRKSAEEELQSAIWDKWKGSQVTIDSNDKGKSLSDEAQKAVDIVSDALKEFETINRTWKNISWDISSDDPTEALEFYNSLVEAREKLVLASKDDETLLDTEIYEDLNTAINTMSESLDTYIEKLYEEEKLNYMAKNGIPSVTEEYKAMESALVSAAGSSADLQDKFKELLTADFSNLATNIENVGDAVGDASAQAEKAIPLFNQLTSSQEALDKFQTSVKSATDAYSTLLSGNYSASELLDSIQAINKAVSDMGGSLDWEFINNQTDSLELLGDAIQHVSQKYAESILSDAGIDVNSEFGQMLANIIQQIYDAEAAFEGMNTQLDNLQSSYQTLTDILESYNKTGYITLDNLQSLLTADENLIQMLEVENGQLVLNQAAYENLVAVQLLEFKAKLNDAAAAEIETLAKQKAEQATNQNADASQNAVEKLDAETAAFNRNTTAAIANAVAKAEESGVSEAEIQGIFDKYTEVWNSAMNNYSLDFDGFMSGGKSAASKAGKEAADAYLDAFEKEYDHLKDQLDRGEISEAQYLSKLRALYTRYFKDRKKYLDEFKKYENEYLTGMLDLHNKALSGISTLLNRRISAANDAKSAAIDAISEEKEARLDAINAEKEARLDLVETKKKELEAEEKLIDKQIAAQNKVIEGIREEIDAMRSANEQKKQAINLQQDEYNLQKLLNQKTKMVYKDGQFIYETDTSRIREAKQKVEDDKLEIAISNKEKEIKLIEKEIDLLNDKKDAISEQISLLDEEIDRINDYYDEMIKDTEKYYDNLIKQQEKYWDSMIKGMEQTKSRYEELAEVEEIAKAFSYIQQAFGDLGYTVEDVLNGSDAAFEDFKSRYIAIMSDMNQNTSFQEGLEYASGVAKESFGSIVSDAQGAVQELSQTFSDGTLSQAITQGVSDGIVSAKQELDNMDQLGRDAGDGLINGWDEKANLFIEAAKQTAIDAVNAFAEGQDSHSPSEAYKSKAIDAIDGLLLGVEENKQSFIDAVRSMGEEGVLAFEEGFNFENSTLNTSFDGLKLLIESVTEALGIGTEGTVGGLLGALDQLSKFSFSEDGIIQQFNNLKDAIDSVTSAIGGGGGESSGGEGQGSSSSSGKGGSSGGKSSEGEGGGGSLTEAITQMGETANEIIGEPEAEGDGTVIGEFGSLETAVKDVTTAIGGGDSEGGEEGSGGGEDEDGGNLIGSINNLGETTEEILGEPGGDGVIHKFEEFKDVIGEANDHVTGISTGLAAIDGQEVECTIKVNIITTGGLPAFAEGTALGKMKLNSAEYNAKYTGSAHYEGTAKVTGDWGVRAAGKALVGELGQEIVVSSDGKWRTVGDNGAEFVYLKENDIVFNHLQTKELLSKGNLVGRGKALADGTALASGTAHVNGTVNDDTPHYPSQEILDFTKRMKKLEMQHELIANYTYGVLSPLHDIKQNTENMISNTNSINNVANNNKSVQQPVNVQIGDINLTGVQDVNGLAQAIKTRLPGQMMQEYFKN